jgi:hypothetical protein
MTSPTISRRRLRFPDRTPLPDRRIKQYGKNAKPEEAPHSFFAHYYGSSWHADDAGFITFLGKSGKLLMYAGILGLGVLSIEGFRQDPDLRSRMNGRERVR